MSFNDVLYLHTDVEDKVKPDVHGDIDTEGKILR